MARKEEPNGMVLEPETGAGSVEEEPEFEYEPGISVDPEAANLPPPSTTSPGMVDAPAPVDRNVSTTSPAPPTLPKTKTKVQKWESTFGPRNRWRRGLCECFDAAVPLSLMSCCGLTHTILLGQLMERLGLDCCGNFDPWQAHNTCRTVTFIWVAYLFLFCMGLSFILWPFMIIWVLILGVRVRGATRDRFNIPPEYCHCCNGCVEDCFCTCFCSCCATIQMARQTHNETKYPYSFSTNTGLPVYAPVIFEHPTLEQIVERGSNNTARTDTRGPPPTTQPPPTHTTPAAAEAAAAAEPSQLAPQLPAEAVTPPPPLREEAMYSPADPPAEPPATYEEAIVPYQGEGYK